MERPTILIVDDDPTVLRAIRSVLRREREVWDITFAGGAAEALDALAQQSFDVIVSDLNMAGMDGCAVLVVAAARQPNAVRLVLTGEADTASLARAGRLANEILSKPCDVEDLRGAIRRSLPGGEGASLRPF